MGSAVKLKSPAGVGAILVRRRMQIATTHTNTDFDALASLVAATFLYPETTGVLPKQVQPNVKEFLTIHRDLFRIVSRQDVDLTGITKLIVVDTNHWNRLDRMSDLQGREDLEIILWDHHMKGGNVEASWKCQQEVGANITLMLREMRKRDLAFAPMQATLFLMGLYDDTGNLSYPSTTKEDAYTAGYLLENGADLNVASAYLNMSFDSQQATALTLMLEGSEVFDAGGYKVGVAFLPVESGLNMLSSVVTKYKELKGLDAAFGIFCTDRDRCIVIGRGDGRGTDVGALVRKLGGGGHPSAGSAMLKTEHPAEIYDRVVHLIHEMKEPKATVEDIMSEVRISLPSTASMLEARCIFDRHHILAAVVADDAKLLGVISSSELGKARSDSQLKAPVKGFMKRKFPTLQPEQNARDAVRYMAESETGLLPVVEEGRLIGVVTRADLMLYIYDL